MPYLNNGKLIGSLRGNTENFTDFSGTLNARENPLTHDPLRAPALLSNHAAAKPPVQRNAPRTRRNAARKESFSVAAFMDYESLDGYCCGKGFSIDFADFRNYLAEEREHRCPLEFFCYVAEDPRDFGSRNAEIGKLETAGWFVKTKMGSYSVNDEFQCSKEGRAAAKCFLRA